MIPYLSVYSVFSSPDEAKKIAEILVKERLVACANIFPGVISIFSWEGKIQTQTETAVFFKTRNSLFGALRDRIQALHSYECPCVVALNVGQGSEKYLRWIDEVTESR